MFSNNMVSFMSWVWNKRKQRNFALWKGPSDKSKYRPSLLLFFAYGGLPREKKILRIWTGSSVNTKYKRDFWWEKRNGTMQDFSRQKTCISFAQLKTIQNRRLFFLWTIFPPKDLVFFGAHFSSLKTFPEREILFAELR